MRIPTFLWLCAAALMFVCAGIQIAKGSYIWAAVDLFVIAPLDLFNAYTAERRR